MSRVLLIGGAGFGGGGLARELVHAGYDVAILDVTAPHASSLLDLLEAGRIHYYWKAAQDISRDDLQGVDVVVNLAAQADVPMGFSSPLWTTYNNVMSTCAALEAARHSRLQKFIHASSGNVYGRPVTLPITEEHPLTPHNPYAASKAAQELYCWAYWRAYQVPIVVMSNGIVAGKHMRREIFLFKWLWNMAQRRPVILEGGQQTRDITHVSDVLEAWRLAIGAPEEAVVGQKFQVSYGEEHTVEELLTMCREVSGAVVPIVRIAYRPGEEGQRECFDITKARERLGYRPKVAPRQTISYTWEWVQELRSKA